MASRFILVSTMIYWQQHSNTDGLAIKWQDSSNEQQPWYLQSDNSDSISRKSYGVLSGSKSRTSSRCEEPFNLPQQLMDWVRESQVDPTVLALMTDVSVNFDSQNRDQKASLDDPVIVPSESCNDAPSSDPDAKLMERALCPWEWRLNRDENREPKLISEARCQCRHSRGATGAECVPIKRDFPVLRKVMCNDDNDFGRFEYRKDYETITVGCHSVMPRVQKARVPAYYFHGRGNT